MTICRTDRVECERGKWWQEPDALDERGQLLSLRDRWTYSRMKGRAIWHRCSTNMGQAELEI